MKKWIIIPLLLLLLFVNGCTSSQKLIPVTSMGVDSTQQVSYSELETMLSQNESFVLLVSLETCESCQDFKPILQQFIIDTSVVVYQIEANNDFHTDNDLFPYTFTPTLFFVDNGKVIKKIDPISDGTAFESLDKFTTFFYQYYSDK